MTPTPAERLKAARDSANLSQQGLADLMGTHVQHVSDVERKKRPPTLEFLVRAARALKIRPSELHPDLTSRKTASAPGTSTSTPSQPPA